MNSFKEKKMNLLRKENMFSLLSKQHKCNTSAIRATQEQYECHTSATQATPVRQKCDTKKKFDFVNERLEIPAVFRL